MNINIMNTNIMNTNAVKGILTSFIVLFSLVGCSKTSDVLLPDQVPSESTPLLKPFSLVLDKGQTATVDITPYVLNTSNSWKLTSVSDPKGLVSGLELSDSHFMMVADFAGITQMSWQVEHNQATYKSSLLVAVRDSRSDNNDPVAKNLVLSTTSDTPLQIDLSDVVSDIDGDELTIGHFTQVENRFSHNGFVVDYDPAGFLGHDSAYYSVSDGKGGIAIGYISIVVNDASSGNTPPVAVDHHVILEQGTAIEVDISPLVDDADGDIVVLDHLYATSNRAVISGNHSIMYYGANFSGQDSLVYVVRDGNGGYAQAEIHFEITEVDAPAPLSLSTIIRNMTVGTTSEIDLSQGVSSSEAWTLDSVVDSSGFVKVDSVNSPSVKLSALSSGIAELTYTVSSGDETKSAALLIAVSEADNTPPLAQNISRNTFNYTAILMDLTDYISDADGDAVAITRIIQAAKPARFTLEDGNKIAYNPRGFIGIDSAVYVVSDGRGGYDLGQLIINVTDASSASPNNAPTAKNYTQTTNNKTPVSLDLLALGLVADADGDELTVTLYSGEGRAKVAGSVVTYTPDGFIGSDEVVYQVSDGQGGYAIGKLLFIVSDVNGSNTLPVTTVATIGLSINQVLNEEDVLIDLSAYVSDADGDSLKISDVRAALNAVSFTGSGSLQVVYHATRSVTDDKFVYVVNDGRGGFAFGEVNITVANQAPTAPAVALSIDPFDSSTPSLAIDMSQYANDIDGDKLTLSLINSVKAPATLTQDGMVLTYTPNGFEGTEVIGYIVTDGLLSAGNLITISSASQGGLTTTDVNLGSMAMDGAMQTVAITDYASNVVGRDVVLVEVVGATLGTTEISADGLSFTYTPNDVSYGEDIFYYHVTDHEGHYATGTVIATLNEPPKPVITDLDINFEVTRAIAVVSCEHCDLERSEYQFTLDDIPVGNNSDSYTYLSHESSQNTGVFVTVKNRYCTAQNTGIAGGNACKTTQGQLIAKSSIVEEIYTTGNAYAALKTDGSVITWGYADSSSVDGLLIDVKEIYSTLYAFAALKTDGTVVTWGDAQYGGDSSAIQHELTGVKEIISNSQAFAALKEDGTVVTWGYGESADSSAVQSELIDVRQIFGNKSAAVVNDTPAGVFIARTGDGSIVAWGAAEYGGDISAIQDQLTNVQQFVFSSAAVAALKSDGTVVAWGGSDFHGGNSDSVQTQLTSVQAIFSTEFAFAALKTDGTVVTWGYSLLGGDSDSVQTQLTNVKTIFSNNVAFAALTEDDTVVTWGSVESGVQSLDLTEVRTVFSNNNAFAALKKDGTVVTWGRDNTFSGTDYGNDSSSVQDQLTDIEQIFSTKFAFAALKADRTIVAWGKGAAVDASTQALLTDVVKVRSDGYAFTVLKVDGSVVAWGSIAGTTSNDISAVEDKLRPSLIEIDKNLDIN